MRKPVTTKDIARFCGVSRGTVDRALNDRPGINAVTKKKILDLARQHGYHTGLLARALSTGRSQTIGIVVFDLRNIFFSQLIESIDKRAKLCGFSVYPVFTDREWSAETDALTRLRSLNVDGIILFPANKGREYEQFLRSLETPIITVGNRLSSRWPFVGIDDSNAIHDAVRLISSRGYDEVFYLSPPLSRGHGRNIFEVTQRLNGFRQGMKECFHSSHPIVIAEGNYLDTLVTKLRNKRGRRIAVLCSSDIYMLRALRRLRAEGLSIPRDVGLMGFDNLEVLQYVQPSLATVDYHIEEIGRAAADLVISLINGEKVATNHVLITHSIIPAESL